MRCQTFSRRFGKLWQQLQTTESVFTKIAPEMSQLVQAAIFFETIPPEKYCEIIQIVLKGNAKAL